MLRPSVADAAFDATQFAELRAALVRGDLRPARARLQRCVLYFLLLVSRTLGVTMPAGLKCEYLINPLGIDAAYPRLSWRMEDSSYGARQTAYQLICGLDSIQVAKNVDNVWNTNKIISGDQLVVYRGPGLKPFTKYSWKVRIWNQKGIVSKDEPISSFEMGMMQMPHWQGAWISDSRDIGLKPAPYLRKTFVANKKIRTARAYIAAAGLYELYINGQIISDHRLDPMYTRFDRRTLYITHDITKE